MANKQQELIPPVAGAAVVTAISQVMGNVTKLAKADKGGLKYDFTSVDDFMAMVNPLCADAGLVIMQDEVECSVENKQLKVKFEFMLLHTSGDSYGPLRRQVSVGAYGAQSYGSAQSYALKQFMRSLFIIATGDKDDPDYGDAQELPDSKPQLLKPQPKDSEPAKPKLTGRQEEIKAFAETFRVKMNGAKDWEALVNIWSENEVTMDGLKDESLPTYEFLSTFFDTQKAKFVDEPEPTDESKPAAVKEKDKENF